MTLNIEHLKELYEKTSDEWELCDSGGDFSIRLPCGEGVAIASAVYPGCVVDLSKDDAAWIVESHNAFPALIERMEKLEAENAQLQRRLNDAVSILTGISKNSAKVVKSLETPINLGS